MPWSWKLARILGIDVYVHATFFMVVAWIALTHWNESQSLAAVVEGVGFILALFACVVVHEFGHALTAAALRYPHTRHYVAPYRGLGSTRTNAGCASPGALGRAGRTGGQRGHCDPAFCLVSIFC